MGTPEFAVAPLKALIQANVSVVAVVTVADKPAGRGRKLHESAVKKAAIEFGIPVLQPTSLKDATFLAELAAFNADLFCCSCIQDVAGSRLEYASIRYV